VWFAPGEKHLHGASPTTAVTHIAIAEALNDKVVDWMEHDEHTAADDLGAKQNATNPGLLRQVPSGARGEGIEFRSQQWIGTMRQRYLDDFTPGEVFKSASHTLSDKDSPRLRKSPAMRIRSIAISIMRGPKGGMRRSRMSFCFSVSARSAQRRSAANSPSRWWRCSAMTPPTARA